MSDISPLRKTAESSPPRDPRSLVFSIVFLSRPRLDILTGLSAFMTILLLVAYVVTQAYPLLFILVGMRVLFEFGVFLTPDTPTDTKTTPSASTTPDAIEGEAPARVRPASALPPVPREAKGGNLFVFLAAAWVIASMFLPVFSSEHLSISIFKILTMLFDEGLRVPVLWELAIFSGLAAVSTFLGYFTRNHPLSILGAYGVYFYARVILDLFLGTGATGNIFLALKQVPPTWLFSQDTFLSFAYHSPATILYVLSSLCLMVACMGIAKGYVDMARRFFGRP